MRVIALGTLTDFWSRPGHQDARGPCLAWYAVVRHAQWRTPADVKTSFQTAGVLQDGRVVFNIGGNKFRIVTWINFDHYTMYVRFIGTHKQYDALDAQRI